MGELHGAANVHPVSEDIDGVGAIPTLCEFIQFEGRRREEKSVSGTLE